MLYKKLLILPGGIRIILKMPERTTNFGCDVILDKQFDGELFEFSVDKLRTLRGNK